MGTPLLPTPEVRVGFFYFAFTESFREIEHFLLQLYSKL